MKQPQTPQDPQLLDLCWGCACGRTAPSYCPLTAPVSGDSSLPTRGCTLSLGMGLSCLPPQHVEGPFFPLRTNLTCPSKSSQEAHSSPFPRPYTPSDILSNSLGCTAHSGCSTLNG